MGHVDGNDDGVGYGVNGQSDKGKGVTGFSKDGDGVYGGSINSSGVSAYSSSGDGVHATSVTLSGVYGFSDSGNGVYGQSNSGDGVHATSGTSSGVYGFSDSGNGVYGQSNSSNAVYGQSDGGDGVHGLSSKSSGVYGGAEGGVGVYGYNSSDSNGIGVYGITNYTPGVWGRTNNPDGFGVIGDSSTGGGVFGRCIPGNDNGVSFGVAGLCRTGSGVHGVSHSSYGVYGMSETGIGVYGTTQTGQFAAVLDGNVNITGRLHKAGGSFRIDHPLDPANKYLYHSFVESPDMKNVYDGVVVLDDKGGAKVRLPDWFGVLNKDFRYQLTAIGAPGPNLHIAEEIISDSSNTTKKHGGGDDKSEGNYFKIAGGTSGMKVSWQVTGVRKDPWANANRIEVEEDKPDKERGYYLYPELYNQPEEKSISYLLFPKIEMVKQELLPKKNKNKQT